MKNFIRKTISIIVIFSLLFIFIGYFLDYQFIKDTSDKFTWMNNIKNQSFDYAFTGSSRAFNMIDINLIDSTFSSNGICLGVGGITYQVLYMNLYTFIKINKNTINEIFIQVDPMMLYKDSIYNKPKYEYNYYSYSWDKNIASALSYPNKAILYKFIPVLKYIEFNEVYNLTHFVRSFGKKSKWEKTKGTAIIYSHADFKIDEDFYHREINKKYMDFNSDDIKYLEKIISLCKESNMNIVLYTAPLYEYEKSLEVIYPNFEKGINQITSKYKIKYFYSNKFNNKKELFKDRGHTNSKGTYLFTKELINARTHNILYK